MIESIVEKYPRTSQGQIVSVESFLEEEALSSHHNGEGSSTHGLVGIDAQGVGTAVDALQEGIESSEDDSTGTDVQESRLQKQRLISLNAACAAGTVRTAALGRGTQTWLLAGCVLDDLLEPYLQQWTHIKGTCRDSQD